MQLKKERKNSCGHVEYIQSRTISAVPVMASSGMEYIWFLVSTFQLLSSSSPTFTSITRKFVPPRSRAKKSPTSVTHTTAESPGFDFSFFFLLLLFYLNQRKIMLWSFYLIPQGWSRHKSEAFSHWTLHASLNAGLSPSRAASSSSPLWALPYSTWTLTGSALPAIRQEVRSCAQNS